MKIMLSFFGGNVQAVNLKENGNVKLENQICSLELSKRLKELGVKQESLFYWHANLPGEYFIYPSSPFFPEKSWREKNMIALDGYSAFTVAELGEMLPSGIFTNKERCLAFSSFAVDGCNEADMRARILIHLIENKLITVEEINK